VLHVQGRPDVEAGVEELLDVLPALQVPGAGDVGVGELVHEEQARAPRQGGVEVHLLEHHSAVLDGAGGEALEALQQARRLRAPVRLHPAHHHVAAGRPRPLGRVQHGVRLADARGGAEEDLQAAARPGSVLRPHALEQGVRVGAALVHHARG
jgi:hypothetical protein